MYVQSDFSLGKSGFFVFNDCSAWWAIRNILPRSNNHSEKTKKTDLVLFRFILGTIKTNFTNLSWTDSHALAERTRIWHKKIGKHQQTTGFARQTQTEERRPQAERLSSSLPRRSNAAGGCKPRWKLPEVQGPRATPWRRGKHCYYRTIQVNSRTVPTHRNSVFAGGEQFSRQTQTFPAVWLVRGEVLSIPKISREIMRNIQAPLTFFLIFVSQ